MDSNAPLVFACSCEGTMPLDSDALGTHGGGRLLCADQLCRAELGRFKAALGEGVPITVGCTQEAPVFAEAADAAGFTAGLRHVDLRGWAGWSDEAEAAGPKMAALIAAAAVPAQPIALVAAKSDGVTLIYGRDETAIELGRRLAEHLDVTVLLDRPGEIAPPRATTFPVLQGRIVGATGSLGGFALTIDEFAAPLPSSRGRLVFGPPRNGATSRCDLVIDVTGAAPLFPAPDLRNGYLRADPRDPAAIERLVFTASHLVGEFDKPRYVSFQENLCAHSRSGITGCTRCLSLCPTGAITPNGDRVALDAAICAGCGSCAAACPTGAAAYALPASDTLMARLRSLVLTYGRAGGRDAVVLFLDGDHGEPLVDALARFGRGLPANVLPIRVNEVSQVGIEVLAAVFAYGGVGARLLVRDRPHHDIEGLRRTIDLAEHLLVGLGYGSGAASVLHADDPDRLSEALDTAPRATRSPKPASFLPLGSKRGLLALSVTELYRAAAAPIAPIPLPALAPFGGLDIDADGCTLCLSCVGACPTSALIDNPERPMLRFSESLCVQCGLCAATCPEDVITLKPQLDIPAWDAPARVVKEEEPFHCIACAKPFGVRSTIERVVERLRGSHWMFSGPAGEKRLDALAMCEDCRVGAMMADGLDPHARPPTRTAADYHLDAENG